MAGVEAASIAATREALHRLVVLTGTLAQRGIAGDVEGMMAHSADYLEAFSIVVVAWQWARMWAAAARREDDAFARGIVRAARYWIATEVPRVVQLAELSEGSDRSYLDAREDEL